jgi:putative ABC transport system permease protein
MEKLRERFALAGTSPIMYANLALTTLLAPELEGILGLSHDIFLICLLVGIVVVANVMLLSVNERRVEIAIRRCEGARTGDIMAQFMLETSLFCATGAMLGIPLGIFLAWVRASLDPSALLTWALPWHHVIVTTVSVLAGGLVAGLAPAWRAARLDPVQVLSRA